MTTYTTIQQISDALNAHNVRITAAQTDADFATSEAARAMTTIYGVGLDAQTYTDTAIQNLRDELTAAYQSADGSIQTALNTAMNAEITSALPGLLNGYYGPYSSMQALYDLLLVRFGQSDAAIDNLLNVVIPGLQADVTSSNLTATTVATDFNALEQSLKSVLVVYADDAAGTNQSLTAGSREYVQYVEYNGAVPTLPVTGTFIKFVGTAQSIWAVYASTSGGNDQSFEPGSRGYVTFYESATAPNLPLIGETFVKYVGNDGSSGERGSGRWYIPVTTLPTTSTEAQNAWNAAPADIPDDPKVQDQAFFYTGAVGNPTGQAVFICDSVTNTTTHAWDYQENVMRGDLLVTGTVTPNEIDSRGLTIRDESNNIILQATGGSAGIDISKVLNKGAFATENQITGANIGTYIASGAIASAYIGDAAITNAKIGSLQVDSAKIANLTIGTGKVADNAITRGDIANGSQLDDIQTTWLLVGQVSVNPEGEVAYCTLNGDFWQNFGGTVTGYPQIQLRRDSTILRTWNLPEAQAVANQTDIPFTFTHADSGAGSSTYLYKMFAKGLTVFNDEMRIKNWSIAVRAFKK